MNDISRWEKSERKRMKMKQKIISYILIFVSVFPRINFEF